jgi:hypothetical protein
MKRLVVILAAAVPMTIVLALLTASATARRREVTHVRTTETSNYFVDNDPSGTSGGDLVGSAGDLRRHGSDIGSFSTACTLVSPVKAQCQGSLIWSGRGTIELAGRLKINQPHNVVAIVGGTHDFRRARGEATLKAGNGPVTRVGLRILR